MINVREKEKKDLFNLNKSNFEENNSNENIFDNNSTTSSNINNKKNYKYNTTNIDIKTTENIIYNPLSFEIDPLGILLRNCTTPSTFFPSSSSRSISNRLKNTLFEFENPHEKDTLSINNNKNRNNNINNINNNNDDNNESVNFSNINNINENTSIIDENNNSLQHAFGYRITKKTAVTLGGEEK